MIVLYRISDGGYNKIKPSYVCNKQSVFLHFLKIFKNYDIYVFADNVSENTYNFLKQKNNSNKSFKRRVIYVFSQLCNCPF